MGVDTDTPTEANRGHFVWVVVIHGAFHTDALEGSCLNCCDHGFAVV